MYCTKNVDKLSHTVDALWDKLAHPQYIADPKFNSFSSKTKT
jgi:hypothetical protein